VIAWLGKPGRVAKELNREWRSIWRLWKKHRGSPWRAGDLQMRPLVLMWRQRGAVVMASSPCGRDCEGYPPRGGVFWVEVEWMQHFSAHAVG
jgi:hypothetical protein